MTNQSAQPITEKEYEPEDLIKALSMSGAQTVGNVSTDNARDALILMGLTVKPEKPEPGTWHIVKDGPQVGDAARVDEDGYLHVIGSNGKTLRDIHPDNTWPALTPARVVPVTTTPVTLTEGQVGQEWDANKVPHLNRWAATLGSLRGSITATVNAALAQHAAPVEGEPIDPDDVREGDRVRLVLDGGDEATCTVASADSFRFDSRHNIYTRHAIRTIHLLHREEA